MTREDKMKILVDCDETLLDTTQVLKKFYLEKIDAKSDIPDGVYCSQWSVWNKNPENWKSFMEAFSHSEYYGNIPPVNGAIEAVNELIIAGSSLTVITSAGQDEHIQAKRRKNLADIFGENTFDDIIFLSLGWSNKKEVMKSLGYDILIDDSLYNARDALEAGVQSIIIEHPNNRHEISNMLQGKDVELNSFSNGITKENFSDLKESAIVAHNWAEVIASVKSFYER